MARGGRRVRFSQANFHRWVADAFRRVPTGPLPVGDDAAAVPIGGRRVAVVTTDALVEGTHFLASSPPSAIGHAAAAVSLSDVAAKGARPEALLLDILVPPSTPESWARAVVAGAERTMDRFGGHVVGGDTKPSETRTVVGTLLGFGRSDRLCPRSGGRPGDLLVVTGVVGRGGADAHELARSREGARASERMLRITPRVAEGAALSRFAHAMLDTSDGVADSTRLLAAASRLAARVEEDQLPLDPRILRGNVTRRERRRRAFYGGDYELLAAIPPGRFPAARRSLARLGCPLTPIGALGRGRGAWLLTGNRREPMPSSGWQPFSA